MPEAFTSALNEAAQKLHNMNHTNEPFYVMIILMILITTVYYNTNTSTNNQTATATTKQRQLQNNTEPRKA